MIEDFIPFSQRFLNLSCAVVALSSNFALAHDFQKLKVFGFHKKCQQNPYPGRILASDG